MSGPSKKILHERAIVRELARAIAVRVVEERPDGSGLRLTTVLRLSPEGRVLSRGHLK